MEAQSLISRGFRADTIYIKLPMLNVSLLTMAFAIKRMDIVGGCWFILILNSPSFSRSLHSFELGTTMYEWGDLWMKWNEAWGLDGRLGGGEKHLYNISY